MAEKIAKRCFLKLFGHSEAQILHASILFPSEHLMTATLQHCNTVTKRVDWVLMAAGERAGQKLGRSGSEAYSGVAAGGGGGTDT